MPDVSLTTFVDFLATTGRKRIQIVEKAKKEDNTPYDPITDFYKRLREGIVSFEHCSLTEEDLLDLPNTLSDHKKKKNYPPAIKGYLKWRKKVAIEKSKNVKGEFSHDELRVRINPEVSLRVNGKRTAMKLYFKQQTLAANRLDLITHLMWFGMPHGYSDGVALMDTRRNKLIGIKDYDPKIQLLLEAEAETFLKLWA
ncbi:MAG: hypothetical protein ABJL17_08775 [Parvibaculum sp.]|jgi:hypothetical protein|uniref:hypothetical protein n=1 Tax=Parvibaculum sp. TaxID=2024848 RepID=UPI003266FA91